MKRWLVWALLLAGCSATHGRSSDESAREGTDGALDSGPETQDSGSDATVATDAASPREAPDAGEGRDASKPGDAAPADGGSSEPDASARDAGRAPAGPTIDELITHCPSSDAVAAIDAVLDLRFDHAPLPKGDEIVCSAAESGRELSHFQERVYQALIAMQAFRFDRPLPWTQRGWYDWLVGEIRGIWFRSDIGNSQCCNAPSGKSGPYINIAVAGGGAVFATDLWGNANGGLYTLVSLFTHEAAHVTKGHSCGVSDKTITELGAWGVEYFLDTYLAYHSDPCFFRPTLPQSSKYPAPLRGDAAYLELARSNASRIQTTRFCSEASLPLAQPTPVRTCKQACVSRQERCNTVDDDCDGQIDEDIQPLDCGIETGECTLGKVTGCELGLERCSGQRPVPEVCGDGLDNDCDGTADGAACNACSGTTGEIFDGSMMIASMADLAGIAGIGCITGTLHVTTNLTELSGLSQLQAVGGDMWVYGNTRIKDLQGLGSLHRVGRLFVEYNPELLTLRGIESLTTIDTYHLMVVGNAKLDNLDGVSGLQSIKSQLVIAENNVLQRVDGLSALTQVGEGVYIRDNPLLPSCRVDEFLRGHVLTCRMCSNNNGTATCAN